MRLRSQQTSFITGAISPTLKGRIELDKYQNAVDEAINVTIMPHGGLTRRSGLKTLTTCTTGARIFSFEFSTTQQYLIELYTTGFKVYLPDSGAVLTTVAWGPSITQTQLDQMDIIQNADTIIITHEDFPPRYIQRQGSDTSWTTGDIELTNIPKFDYDGIIPLYSYYGFDDTVYSVQIDDVVYLQDNNDNKGLNQHKYKAKYDFQGSFDDVDFSVATYTNINTGTATSITLITNFTVVYNNDGNDINGLTGRIYRYIGTGATGVNLATEDYTDDSKWIENGAWEDLGLREDVWGDTSGTYTDRGYPRTCTFHQGRLWFGGSKTKPTSVWGSVVNNYYNFDTGTNDVSPDDAIFDILDTDQFNAIENIVSGTKLQVLTAGGEFVNTADVITPTDSSWTRYTSYGAKRLKPVTLDGSTYYMDRFGKTVRGIIYDFEEGGYTTPPISILSEHLINGVVDMDIVRGSSISVANLMYLVNSDGTVAVYNTMRRENISGWTQWTTEGEFKHVSIVGEYTTFIVERDGVQYIEVIDDSILLDHAFIDADTDNVEVDQFLYDNGLKVVADSITQTTLSAVESGGQYYAYADRTAENIYSGIDYEVKVKTLPPALNSQTDGNIAFIPKRITRCIVQLYNSRGVYINDKLVTSRKFGEATDAVFEPITGLELVSLLGYYRDVSIEVTQKNPDPMTLLALDIEISF